MCNVTGSQLNREAQWRCVLGIAWHRASQLDNTCSMSAARRRVNITRMIRLVYVSTCADNVQLSDIQALLLAAERRNPALGLSGMLCWSGEFFLQCIEGERAAVTACFARILTDNRHHSVELILSAPTAVRWFSRWGMGFSRMLSSNRVDSPAWTGNSFNPYLLEAVELEATFERLAGQAQKLQGVDVTIPPAGLG